MTMAVETKRDVEILTASIGRELRVMEHSIAKTKKKLKKLKKEKWTTRKKLCYGFLNIKT